MKKKSKLKYIITAFISVVIAAAVILGLFAATAAEESNVYVSDIRIGYGHTEEDAKKQLEDAGYTVVPVNLSKSCSYYEWYIKNVSKYDYDLPTTMEDDSDYGYSYMGYKTTLDRKAAITDVRLMNMNYGYKTIDYRTLAESWNANIAKTAFGLRQSVNLMKDNIASGSPLAEAGKYILDIFYYRDIKGNTYSLSDWLFDNSRTDTDYKDLILIANSEVMSYIYSAVNLGVADAGNSNFAQRFQTVQTYNFESVGEYEPYDIKYWDSAKSLVSQIIDYATQCTEAQNQFGIDASDDEAVKNLEIKLDTGDAENEEEAIDDILEQQRTDLQAKTQNYLMYLISYNRLSKYEVPDGLASENYGSPSNLAEYLTRFGNSVKAENLTDADIRYLYPFVEALSEGASAAISVSGIMSSSLYLGGNTEENANKIISDIEENILPLIEKSESKYVNDNNKIDVFVGTDRSMYDCQIALTASSIQEAAASGEYDEITADISNFERGLLKVVRYVACIACFTFAAAIIVNIGLNIAFGAGFGLLSATIVLAWGGTFLAGSASIGMMVGGIIGATALGAVVIVAAVIVVCAIVYGIYKLIEKIKEDTVELDPVPNIMVDHCEKTDRYVAYQPVLTLDGKAADLGQYKEKTWDVFYYTTSSAAGSPIVLQKDGTLFSYNNNGITPDRMRPLARFDQLCAVNLGMYAEDSIYFYFYSVDSLDGKEGGSASENGVYISHLCVKSSKNAREAQLELVKTGYTFIDTDLSPNSDYFTYLGFKTTKLESEAVRDIRVLFGQTITDKTSASFGDFSYTNAGITNTGAAIFYTKIPGAGTPIYADMLLTKQKSDSPEGWEPVNLFCGGDAFNFGMTKSIGSSKWNNGLYIYFHPKDMFTGDKEYISGFAFFSGKDCNGQSLEQYASSCGYEMLNTLGTTDICKGAIEEKGYTVMGISKTANPYRAISDIKIYVGSDCTQMLPDVISVAGKGTYTACDVYSQLRGNRSMRSSNAYVTNIEDENGVVIYFVDEAKIDFNTRIVLNEEGEADGIIARGLYVLGPKSELSPLSVSDLLVSLDKDSVEGYRPVTDITDFYGTSARNLTYEYTDADYYEHVNEFGLSSTYSAYAVETSFSTHLYLHIKGKQDVKPKYVGAVNVITSADKDFSDDEAVLTALSKYGPGKLIRTNLAKNIENQSYTLKSDGKTDNRKISGNTSYIYVTYIPTKAFSLRRIIIYPISDVNKTPVEFTKIDGVDYTRCGDIIKAYNGNYCLYSVQNAGFGLPLTDIFVSEYALTQGCITSVYADGSPVKNTDFYIQGQTLVSSSESETNYITSFDYEENKSLAECVKALYFRGNTGYAVTCHMSENNSVYHCIGYNTTLKKTNNNIITGIKAITSESEISPGDKRVIDGIEYTLECSAVKDPDYGTAYLYSTRDKSLNPVSEIYICPLKATSPYMPFAKRIFTEYLQSSGAFLHSGLCDFEIYYKSVGYWSLYRNNLTLNYDGLMPEYGGIVYGEFLSESGFFANDNFKIEAEWLKQASKIKTVTVNSKVDNLPAYVFSKCENLSSVTVLNPKLNIAEWAIPAGTKIIASYNSTAYSYYLSHKDSYMPSSAGDRGGKGGKGVTFEPIFETVCGSLCDNITFKISDGVMTVAGKGNINITDKTSPVISRLIQLGYTSETAALYLNSVTEIYFNDGITGICAGCFECMPDIKKITIPQSITAIGDGVFANLDNVEFCVTAGSVADGFVQKLNGSGKHDTVSYLRDNGIAVNDSVKYVIGGNVLIIYGNGAVTEQFLTDEDNSKYAIEKITVEEGITSLPDGIFRAEGCLKNVKTIELPSTLKSIPDNFCYGQRELENLNLPSGITSVGAYAFADCGKLFAQMTVIPATVTTIGEKAFYNVSASAQLVVQNISADIAEDAFDTGKEYFRFGFGEFTDGADNSVQFTLTDDSIVISGTGALPALNENGLSATPWAKAMLYYGYTEEEISEYLSSVKTITVESGITELKSGYFDYLTGVEIINIKNTDCLFTADVFSKQKDAVIHCRAQTPLCNRVIDCIINGANFGIYIIPENEVEISGTSTYYMFCNDMLVIGGTGEIIGNFLTDINYDTKLKYIVVNEGITSLPQGIFDGYSKNYLEDVNAVIFPSTLTAIPSECCQFMHSLVFANIPAGVTSIGDSAFDNCSEMFKNTSLFIIPESVTEIGSYAFDFWNCNVTVVVPETVGVIGRSALAYAKEIFFLGQPDADSRAFSSTALVYAPEGSKMLDLAAEIGAGRIQWIDDGNEFTYTALTKVTVPDRKSDTAYFPSDAEYLHIRGDFKSIGQYAFAGIKSLKYADLHCGVDNTIGAYIFAGCENLESISIKNDFIWGFDNLAFSGCSAKVYCATGTISASSLDDAKIEHIVPTGLASSVFSGKRNVFVIIIVLGTIVIVGAVFVFAKRFKNRLKK